MNKEKKEKLKKLKDYFQILDYLDDRGIDYKESGDNVSYGWIGLSICPFNGCTDYHFGIDKGDNHYNCWICGATNDVIDYIMKQEECTFSDAVDILREFSGNKRYVVEAKEKEVEVLYQKMPIGARKIKEGNEPEMVVEWCKRRRFDLSLLQRYKVYWCQVGEHPLSMIVPITIDKELVSYMSVDVTGKRYSKYEICADRKALVKRSEVVYGIDDCVKKRQVVIVEGITDKWRVETIAGNSGVDCGSIALLTKTWNISKLWRIAERIRKECRVVKVMLDMDAMKEGERLSKEMAMVFPNVVFIGLEEHDGKDPDLLPKKKMLEVLNYG